VDPDPASFLLVQSTFSEFLSGYWMFFVLVGVLLILSAISAATEVAFFSLTKVEIEEIREGNSRSDRVVLDLLQRPKQLLATLLIFNNLINIGMVILSTFLLGELVTAMSWGQQLVIDPVTQAQSWVKVEWQLVVIKIVEVGVITFILMFFGEIMPKVYGTQNRERLVRSMAYWVRPVSAILYPVSWLLINTTKFIDTRFKAEKSEASFEEIKHAIDLTSEEESPDEEKEILKGIVTFSSISVKNIMHPRVNVHAVEFSLPFPELVDQINEFGYSRLPVYEDSLDNVKGVLYIKDLLPMLKEKSTDVKWQVLVRPPYFVPESKKIDDLLDEFKSKRLHIAIVVDEFGGTAGLVTLEDIVEEIFGEINDEFDEDEAQWSMLSEHEFVFDGKIPLNDVLKVTGVPDDAFQAARGEADSLGGLILELCGKFPDKGDVIEMDGYRFLIESVSRNRISRIKMIIPQHENANGANE
jgi:putative hemolysin